MAPRKEPREPEVQGRQKKPGREVKITLFVDRGHPSARFRWRGEVFTNNGATLEDAEAAARKRLERLRETEKGL